MNANATRTRRPAKPTVARLLAAPICPCEMLPAGLAGQVEINGDAYALEVNAELPEAGEPRVFGYRVTKVSDPASSYDLPQDLARCECMGHLRYGYCRHQTALRQLRQAGHI